MNLILVFVSAFLVRLIHLNQSFWLDEATVAKVVKTIPFLQIPFRFSPGDFHPPLYYLFISLWSSIFGYSEIALRMLSILFSLIAGWYVFETGSLIKDKKTGQWAALFFLFNPLIIYYSQEARMYMMATALLSITLYHFLLLIKENQSSKFKFKSIVLFNLFAALATLVFYGSLFFIAALIIVGFFISLKKHVFRFQGFELTVGVFLSLLLLSPLLFRQLINAKVGLAQVRNWNLVLGKAELKNVFMIFVKFTIGRLSWYPKWSYYITAGIVTSITWLFIGNGMKKNTLLTSLLILPVLLGLLVSLWAPMMMYFRFIYLIPVMCILLALNKTEKKFIFGYCIIFIFLISSFVYLLDPYFHREDWKNLTKELQKNIPVYMIIPSSDPVLYYGNGISLYELRDIGSSTLPKVLDVIPYTSEIYGFNYVQLLHEKECIEMSTAYFRGDLTLEKWKCN